MKLNFNRLSDTEVGVALLTLFSCIMGFAIALALIAIRGPEPNAEPSINPTQIRLIERVWELDSIILNHTYGPLVTRYEYGAVEKDYNRKWHITSDSLYALRRRAQNEFNAYNTKQ